MKKIKILLTIGNYIDDFCYIIGTAAVSYGTWLIYKPASCIVAGILLIAYGIMISRARRQ